MTYSYNDELSVEKRLIEVLGEGHNQWNYRSDLKSEDDLWSNLRTKITQNNLDLLNDVPITDNEFSLLKTELLSRTRTPFDAARWLKGENGIARITIARDDVALGTVSLVLYSNHDIGGGISSYEVVNQIATKPSEEGGRNRRFDVTLLINGLPIVQIELKRVSAQDGVYQAFNQIKKYAEEGLFRNNIFSTLQLFVISNEQTTRYFANSMPKDMHRKFVFRWRTKDNRNVEDIYEFSKQVLNIPDAHRLIADYTIVSEDQDNKHLMVLHPYQIHAIEALYRAAAKHQSGYIWHATGSGKTLTSFVSTKLLARKSGVDRTIMLVDRKDLDNQTTNEFTKFASEFNTGISSGRGVANSLIVGTGSAKELSEALLSDSNNNTIIITTRQKLEAALRYAEKQEKEALKFQKLLGQHLVIVVDECHRAVSSEGMEAIKKYFPNATWFGFTGTPIFEVNKKQANGKLARTTDDQYGECFHTYTIKNALDDQSVLGFQVEHDDTIGKNNLDAIIYRSMRMDDKYSSFSNDEINDIIDSMKPMEKESFINSAQYNSDDHVKQVVHKIFKPNNVYTKFKFSNGKPQMSAILTTSSIDMAKRYYYMIREMTSQDNWLEENYKSEPLREGRTIDDSDFPRIAVTYSVQENEKESAADQKEMDNIIKDYNKRYGTSWSVSDIDRYNGDVNNRLARKKGEFKQPGKQVDLVIVVDRLLTGFDAPTIQTLFVDRNLTYANLIQAFSRTNRTYPGKEKGMIVTFRKPKTMEYNVGEATRLYSNEQEDNGLIYPSYSETYKKFKKASKKFRDLYSFPIEFSEDAPIENNIEFVKVYQELNRSLKALSTYEEYDKAIESSIALQEDVVLLTKNEGLYNTVKGYLKSIDGKEDFTDGLSDIEFFSDNVATMYDIDSAYINKLLGIYTAYNKSIRDDIEKALVKMNKVEIVKDVYNRILDDIDSGLIDKDEDIFSVKRHYFTEKRKFEIQEFASKWVVSEDQLYTSAVQYTAGMNPVPNLRGIINNSRFDEYVILNPGINKLKYISKVKENWSSLLDTTIAPLENELR